MNNEIRQIINVINNYGYNNSIYSDINFEVYENDSQIQISIYIDSKNKEYEIEFSDEYNFKLIKKINTNDFNTLLTLLEKELKNLERYNSCF